MSHDFLNLTSSLQRVYSDRIALRPVSMADGWPLFEATKNPLFNKYLMWSRPKDASETLERIDMIADAVAKGQMSAVSVVLRSTGEWIGLFRFQPYRQFDDTLEIGFWSRDTFWQGRFGIEVGVLCVAAAFKLSTVSRIVGASSPENRSSTHGMQLGGLKPGEITYRRTEDDEEVALQEFSVTRDEWIRSGHGEKLFNFRSRVYSHARGIRPQNTGPEQSGEGFQCSPPPDVQIATPPIGQKILLCDMTDG